jgi:hypothetical protein
MSEGFTSPPPEIDPDQEPVNRTRRFVYIATVTATSVILATVIAYTHPEGRVAEAVVDGLLTLAQIVAIAYVTASAVDRSNILGKIGESIGGRRRRQSFEYEQSPYGSSYSSYGGRQSGYYNRSPQYDPEEGVVGMNHRELGGSG